MKRETQQAINAADAWLTSNGYPPLKKSLWLRMQYFVGRVLYRIACKLAPLEVIVDYNPFSDEEKQKLRAAADEWIKNPPKVTPIYPLRDMKIIKTSIAGQSVNTHYDNQQLCKQCGAHINVPHFDGCPLSLQDQR